MNREYNDNKMYNSALDELRFSDEAKSRMVNRLMAAAEQPEQPVAIHRVRRFPRIAAVGVAAALVLSIGAGATGVFKSASDAFAGVFGPTADTEIIDQIGRPIGASDTSNGVTVTADAILFDGYNYLISYTLEKEDGSAFDCTKNPDTGWYHYAPMLLSDYTPELAATHHIAGCSVEAMQTLFDQIVSGTAGM